MRMALLAAGVLFALFLLAKLLRPRARRTPAQREALARLNALKQQAREPERSAAERAALLRSAAGIALHQLGRAGLAASLARRADRLDPDEAAGVGLIALALRKQARFAALERLLWRKLADAPAPAVVQRAREELQQLYEGPLKRPEVAAALRRFS
jgi:hypothetical protein